jgi:L-threonylcarbamoyladenylate synthase
VTFTQLERSVTIMTHIKTLNLTRTPADLAQAAALLRAGDLVSFPTETVYGLGADARQGQAVARIYTTKGRPSFNPLIVHVADVDAAKRHVIWNAQAELLAQAFWPGPITLVLPLREESGISGLVTAGLSTLAVRVPAHPAAHELLRCFDGPLAAPSANLSGKISPTRADHVRAGLAGKIAAIVDDGSCEVGVESTIIGLAGSGPVLLRAGGLAAEDIEQVLGCRLRQLDGSEGIAAPGMLTSHYAPGATVRLNATAARNGEVLLGFGDVSGDVSLSPTGDLPEAAAKLFDALHQLDAMAAPIAVAPIPDIGLGRAINDRLRRAAAPRE